MSEHGWAATSRTQRSFQSDREFRLWQWSPHHDELLLRSPGIRGRANFDVVFTAVDSVSLPSRVQGLRIDAEHVGPTPDSTVFRIRDGEGRDVGAVVAAAWRAGDNTREPGAASPLNTSSDHAAFERYFEMSVLIALHDYAPVEPARPDNRDVDMWLHTPGGATVAVQAKAVPTLRIGSRLNALADEAVRRAHRAADSQSPPAAFLVVLGTWSSSRPAPTGRDGDLVERFGDRLRSRLPLGTDAGVVAWTPGEDPSVLGAALRTLAGG